MVLFSGLITTCAPQLGRIGQSAKIIFFDLGCPNSRRSSALGLKEQLNNNPRKHSITENQEKTTAKHDGGARVRIHINQKPYESPNPTTRAELYKLGHIPPGQILYREVRGDREDTAIEDGPECIHLTQDEHFHSGAPAEITIIVEGTPHEWEKPEISYAEVVTLFDPEFPKHPEVTYSVTYKHGPSQNPDGILAPGASVKVKNRMVFNVSRTGQS